MKLRKERIGISMAKAGKQTSVYAVCFFSLSGIKENLLNE
jgi:hypothetical protein